MKLRAIWAILAANLVAAILLSFAGFLTVRYAPWGHLATDASKMSPQGLAVKYGDAAALLRRGLFVDLWITGPIIAILTGLTSGAFYRRADWRVSSLSTAVLIIFTVSTMNVVNISAALFYLLLSWMAMKLVGPGPAFRRQH